MLRFGYISLFGLSIGLISGGAAFGQASIRPQTPLAATAQSAVPALISYSGVAFDVEGKPVAGEAGMTFLVFKDEQGGEPLWVESQSVELSANGHYKVELGAGNPSGLPHDLFSTGEARWLEVQVAGQQPQARVLLASVPYSMKAADAATLGGLPASAFVRADDLRTAAAALVSAAPLATTTGNAVTTIGGSAGFLPIFTGAATIANSEIFDTGSAVGIGTAAPLAKLDVNGNALISGQLAAEGATIYGLLQLPKNGTGTATAGQNSHPLLFQASAFNANAKSAVSQEFEWQAEPEGNNTASPSATLNLLASGTGSSSPSETGFYFNINGTIHFAPGQSFPGASGNGTITGVTAGTGLTGGGASGNVSLAVNQSVVAFQSDLTNAEKNLSASIVTAENAAVSISESYAKGAFLPLSGGAVNGPVTFTSPISQSYASGSSFTVHAADGFDNIGAFGQGISLVAGVGSTGSSAGEPGGDGGSINLTAGAGGNTQNENSGNAGNIVLTAGAPGSAGGGYYPGLVGHILVVGDDTSAERGSPSQLQIRGASNGNKQLLIGYYADGGSDNGWGAIQATNAGNVNTPLILNPSGGGVGIQTTDVTNSLTIGQGQGPAVADGWNTYSSRRFKTDVRTLTGALDKVERMRGVSYTLKATGKREIGVIAEEVGKVLPEVVTYEKNGVDAQSVDYTRLSALLIEAVKQQQAQIDKQNAELQAAILQIHSQQRQIRKLAAWKSPKSLMQTRNAGLHQANQLAGAPDSLLAASR